MVDSSACRVLVLVAHPDDAEVGAGGFIVRHCRAGSRMRIASVTDGRGGHHAMEPDRLVEVRRAEARAAGERVGAEYETWHFHDGSLEPTLEVRHAIIRAIRGFAPDLVLTHRTNDYHPDHRAVGIAVQDASYLVTVPHVCPDTPALKRDPVVASMCDLFTRPNPLRPDVILDVTAELDVAVQMAACHASQFFEWLPYHDGVLDSVPTSADERFEWLMEWMRGLHHARRIHFQEELVRRKLPLDDASAIEVFELSEYAGRADADHLRSLFPGML